MKKIFLLIVILSSCMRIPKYDVSGFTNDAYTIYYHGEVVARTKETELSIDNGRYVDEVTLVLEDPKYSHLVKPILYYIWEKHPKWDVEMSVPLAKFKQ